MYPCFHPIPAEYKYKHFREDGRRKEIREK